MKKCCTCKQTKQLGEFGKNKSRKDGLANFCKMCQKVYNENHSEHSAKKRQEFLNSYKNPHESKSDAAIRYFCETHGKEKWYEICGKRTRLGSDGCVLWTGALNSSGYPTYGIPLPYSAWPIGGHRLSFAVHHGYNALPHAEFPPKADTLVLDHICENPACVNPLHLQVVTHSENLSFIHHGRAAV